LLIDSNYTFEYYNEVNKNDQFNLFKIASAVFLALAAARPPATMETAVAL